MKLTYRPFRGEIEPVTKVHESAIRLLKDYIEVASYYEYEAMDEDGIVKPDVVKGLDFFPRTGLSITIEGVSHKADKDNKIFSRLKICAMTGEEVFVSATDEEVYELYKKIKNWLLNA